MLSAFLDFFKNEAFQINETVLIIGECIEHVICLYLLIGASIQLLNGNEIIGANTWRFSFECYSLIDLLLLIIIQIYQRRLVIVLFLECPLLLFFLVVLEEVYEFYFLDLVVIWRVSLLRGFIFKFNLFLLLLLLLFFLVELFVDNTKEIFKLIIFGTVINSHEVFIKILMRELHHVGRFFYLIIILVNFFFLKRKIGKRLIFHFACLLF